ncbi:MAG: hypothetical protein OEV26_00740 [Gallionella sp.]|nr:hypothetical protein [Gallionella sp.]MDH4285936.1 hypothetical protein [Gallionella sp.]
MKKLLLLLASVVTIVFSSASVYAEDVPFPADWAKWNKMKTKLSALNALPSCDGENAAVSQFPQIYQKVVETYCGLKANGPGRVDILVNPAAQKNYDARDGKMPEGVNMVLRFDAVKLLLVTAHKGGKPMYAVFTEAGERVVTKGPLSVDTCENCHTGYQAFCVNGQCGRRQ